MVLIRNFLMFRAIRGVYLVYQTIACTETLYRDDNKQRHEGISSKYMKNKTIILTFQRSPSVGPTYCKLLTFETSKFLLYFSGNSFAPQQYLRNIYASLLCRACVHAEVYFATLFWFEKFLSLTFILCKRGT